MIKDGGIADYDEETSFKDVEAWDWDWDLCFQQLPATFWKAKAWYEWREEGRGEGTIGN